MSRLPTLVIITQNMALGRLYTEADRAYCTAFNFIHERFTQDVALDAAADLVGGGTTSVVRVTRFPDPNPGSMRNIFVFKSSQEWADWYRPRCLASAMVDRTEALTYWPERSIGVNIPYHTFGTLVHECFHLLSHADFRRGVTGDQNEGCTELLTRAVLGIGRRDPRRDVRGVGDIYGTQLSQVSRWIDREVPEDILRLLRAYALGDATEIRILRAFFDR